MAKSKGLGRRKGSRNKGYFYRAGRGWYAKDGKQWVPLTDDNGDRLREESTPDTLVKEAFYRWSLSKPAVVEPTCEVTILEVCSAYLAKAIESRGHNKTFSDRAETLFDFCYGLPARFRAHDGTTKGTPTRAEKVHAGYGGFIVTKLKPLDIDQWLQAHPRWNGGKRTHIKAVVRALNYGVDAGLIPLNPIKGYRTPKVNGRIAYITPEQEEALCELAHPALAKAIKVLIRTGMRPGIEFCALTAGHVKDYGDRMELVFLADESKTKRQRLIRVVDPATLATIREQMELHPEGPIFTSPRGESWSQSNLSKRFRAVKVRLIEKGMKFDRDCVLYATRHTYAKRILQGYWTGKQTNIETLARLMGNSPQICREHYLQWTDTYNEPLWEAC